MDKAPVVNPDDLPALSDLAMCMTMFTFACFYRNKEERQNFIDIWAERAGLQNLNKESIKRVVKYFNDTMAGIPCDE